MKSRKKYYENIEKVNRNLKLAWYLGVIIVLGLAGIIAYYKSFQFSLFGDDWYELYIVEILFGEGKQWAYYDPSSYNHPWGSQYIIMASINNFFGHSSGFYYFLSSFLLRLVTALSAYYFLIYITKEKFLSLIGATFVMVGYAGVETTNWVFHMNTFVTTSLLFVLLRKHFANHEKKSLRGFLVVLFLFLLMIISAPIRTHGMFPLFVSIELLLWLVYRRYSATVFGLRELGFFLTTYLAQRLGFFGSYGFGKSFDFLKFDDVFLKLQSGDFSIISSTFVNVGRVFLPDVYRFSPETIRAVLGDHWIRMTLIVFIVFSSFVFWIISKSTKERVYAFLVSISIFSPLSLVVTLIFKQLPVNANIINSYMTALVGVFVISLSVYSLFVLFVLKEKKNTWISLVVVNLIILSSMALPILFNTGSFFGASHRYFTIGLMGLAIFVSALLKVSVKGRYVELFLLFFVGLMFFNLVSVRKYFNDLYPMRSNIATRNVWKIFSANLPVPFPNELTLFYFDNSENSALAHNTLLFGFNPRMGLELGIEDVPKLPAYTTSYDEIISAVVDGESFKRLGHPVEPIPVERIFAYKFTKDGDIVNITEQTRTDLLKVVK